MILILNELKFSDARTLTKTAKNFQMSSYDEWIEYLEQNGFIGLGSGAFSEVYGKDGSNLVVRISQDWAWMQFYEFAYKNQRKNKHLPRISKIISADDGWYLVFMERLNLVVLPEHIKHNLRQIINQTNQARDGRIRPVSRTIKMLRRDLVDELGSSFMRLFDALRSSKLRGVLHWDLHHQNIMQRKDGTLVIIDPYADLEDY